MSVHGNAFRFRPQYQDNKLQNDRSYIMCALMALVSCLISKVRGRL